MAKLGCNRRAVRKWAAAASACPWSNSRQAEVVGRLSIVGLKSQRGAAAVDRPINLAHGAIGQGQVGVVGRGRRIPRDRPTDPFGCPHGIALLVGNNSQQVHGLGVIRLRRKEMTIRLGRLVEQPRSCCSRASFNSSA